MRLSSAGSGSSCAMASASVRRVTNAINPPSVLTNDSAIQANRMTNSARMTVSSPVSPPTASTRYIS